MGLGRRTGDELDWNRIAGSIGQIGGALQRGGKYQDYRAGMEKEDEITQAQQKAQTAMQLDVSPEDARTQIQEQTRYKEPGFIGKIMGEEGTYERSFSPDVAETGFQRAIATEMKSSEALINKQTEDYAREFAGKSPEEMQKLDTTKMKNPMAAGRAKGRYFVEYGATEKARGMANENARKTREDMYKKFSSAINTADDLLKSRSDANKNKSVSVMVDATNNMNNTAYQAEEVSMNGQPMIRTFMVYDGEKRDGDTYTPEEYSRVLKGITKQAYYQAFDQDRRMSEDMNKKSLENPDWMVNDKGEMVQVQTFRNPLTADHKYMVYSREGGMYPIQDRQELYKQGFRNFTPSKKADTKTGTGKASSKKVTENLKVLDKAIELVKQSGRYTTDMDGNITETATGKPAGEQLVMEAIQMMPELGKALSQGEVQELLQYMQAGAKDVGEDGVYEELGVFETPQTQAIQTRTVVTPETNPALQRSPFN